MIRFLLILIQFVFLLIIVSWAIQNSKTVSFIFSDITITTSTSIIIIGLIILICSTIGIIVYGWLLFYTDNTVLVLQITAFFAVAFLLVILAWIGWTMARTPPPPPIDPIDSPSSSSKKDSKKN